jgi:hypothetical protein
MPLKPHPTDPDKTVYCSRQYDIPQLQGAKMKTYEDDEFERIEREFKWRQIPDDPPKAIPFITEEELEQLLKEET